MTTAFLLLVQLLRILQRDTRVNAASFDADKGCALAQERVDGAGCAQRASPGVGFFDRASFGALTAAPEGCAVACRILVCTEHRLTEMQAAGCTARRAQERVDGAGCAQ